MSAKNLVYNKLARQNIFSFVNSVSIIVVLTYCYCSYSYCYSYYYHYCFYYFVIIIYFIVIIVIIIIVFSQCYFILFYFLLFILLLVLSVCCLWRVCVPSCFFFFPFLVNDLHFILALLIHVKDRFSFVIIVYIIVLITIILFFQHYQSLGENLANEFKRHGVPLPIDYFG